MLKIACINASIDLIYIELKAKEGKYMDTIKCGRVTYELVEGDTVMDNGHCFQLITRRIGNGFNTYPPRVSKAQFKIFKEMNRVSENVLKNTVNWCYK